MSNQPTDNLIRARVGGDTVQLRNDDGDGRTLHGHFAVFNQWTEIDSAWEGRFLERVAPGAFADVFRDTSQTRVLYEHGADPTIGRKPIAEPKVVREDERGAYYEAELFDADYAEQLLPALRSGQLGASFRFSVADQEWVTPKKAADHNPDRLEERTITKVARLYEFGPVTWGAYPAASSGVRSETDEWYERLHSDPLFAVRYADHVGANLVERMLLSDARSGSDILNTPKSADGHSDTDQRAFMDRRAELVRLRSIVRTL